MWKPSARDQPPAPRRIGSVLRGTGPSGALAEKARTLVRAERAVHRVLGEKSAPHVRAGKLSATSLTLTADTPAWASMARFRAPDVRAALRSELPTPCARSGVVIREMEYPAAPGPATAHRTLSPFAARVLRSVARSLDNPRLARILIRLAARERPARRLRVRERLLACKSHQLSSHTRKIPRIFRDGRSTRKTLRVFRGLGAETPRCRAARTERAHDALLKGEPETDEAPVALRPGERAIQGWIARPASEAGTAERSR